MAVNTHKGTLGHSIGQSILGRDQPPGTSKASQVNIKSAQGPSQEAKTDFHHISVTRAHNGFSISHSAKGKDGAPSEDTTHVFTDPADAHAHLGNLLDCPGCSGQGR